MTGTGQEPTGEHLGPQLSFGFAAPEGLQQKATFYQVPVVMMG